MSEDVGISIKSFEATSKPTFVARYNLGTKSVLITGGGYVPGDGELRIAAGFTNLTVKQATAMALGLKVLEFLRTGEYPPNDFGNPQTEPNVAMNYDVAHTHGVE